MRIIRKIFPIVFFSLALNCLAEGTMPGAAEDAKNQPATSESVDDNTPLSYEQRKVISMGVNMLVSPHFWGLINVIKERHPELITPDGVEIDFEEMQPATLRAIERYLLTVVPDFRERAAQYIDEEDNLEDDEPA